MNVEEGVCVSDAWELQKYLECDLIPLHYQPPCYTYMRDIALRRSSQDATVVALGLRAELHASMRREAV